VAGNTNRWYRDHGAASMTKNASTAVGDHFKNPVTPVSEVVRAVNRTITLGDDLYEAVSKQARADGVAEAEVVREALRVLQSVRGIDTSVAENRQDMEAMGLKEDDVERMIAEYRKERRH
jgi:hypothetical protein